MASKASAGTVQTSKVQHEHEHEHEHEQDHHKPDSQPRMEINSTINELIVACQRSKYQEAVIFHERRYRATEHCKKRQRTQSVSFGVSQCRTWTEILNDLCTFMPLITDEDYALVSRLVSLCLLTYLMPQRCHVTNIDSSQNVVIPAPSLGTVNKGHGLLQLEEILEKSPQIRHLASSQFNPCAVQDERVSSAFWDFLHIGLGPFLSSRPMSRSLSSGSSDTESNCGCADLLHVLSMAISGDFPDSSQADTIIGSDENGNEVEIPLSNRVRGLISNKQSEYFQISALQRAKLVHVVAHGLVLPKMQVPKDNECLLMGGVLYLRAAMKSFCLSALSNHQVIDAKRGLVWSAIDTECFARVEMKALVSSLVNDKSKTRSGGQCTCRRVDCSSPRSRELKTHFKRYIDGPPHIRASGSIFRQQILRERDLDADVCVHCADGDLLCDLILRYNGSRHYADGTFTGQALAELTCAIATLLGQIDSSSVDGSVDLSTLPTSCSISSLMDAARALFYFLLSSNETDDDGDSHADEAESAAREARELENGMKGALLECVIQLLGSRDRCIAISASSLLALALAYENQARIQNIVVEVFTTLESALHKSTTVDDYADVVEVLSRKSNQFAASMVSCIIDLLNKSNVSDPSGSTGSGKVALLRLLLVISAAQPRVVVQHLDRVQSAVGDLPKSSEDIAKQVVAVYLTCNGLTYTMNKANEKYLEYINESLSFVYNSWSMFQLARHALHTANFQVAREIFEKRLVACVSTTSSYLWMSSLAAVARAEHFISEEGCSGIPTAMSDLDSAINKIRSMHQDSPFQIEILSLRKDFLYLCLVITNLCAEMRLTNTPGIRFTRNCLHQQNISRCFYMLGSRYCSLYKCYGILNCQQTRSTIRSQFGLCRFLGDITGKIFSASQKHSRSASTLQQKESLDLPRGDMNRIQGQLIQKLRSELIGTLDDSLEPASRANTLFEVVDTILKCPNPYPKGFTVLKTVPVVKVKVAAKGSPKDLQSIEETNKLFADLSLDNDSSCKVQLGRPLHLRLSGSLPETLLTSSDLPFTQIIASCSLSFDGPLVRDVDVEDSTVVEKGNELEVINTTATTDLLPSYNSESRFVIDCECPLFPREGYYEIEIKLLLRDIRCGEYEITTNFDGERLIVACKPANAVSS